MIDVQNYIMYPSWLQISGLLLYHQKRGWDKSPSLSIVFGLSSKTQWLSGLYYADFISFYSPTQLCGGGTTKSNSNELPISVPLSFVLRFNTVQHTWEWNGFTDMLGPCYKGYHTLDTDTEATVRNCSILTKIQVEFIF